MRKESEIILPLPKATTHPFTILYWEKILTIKVGGSTWAPLYFWYRSKKKTGTVEYNRATVEMTEKEWDASTSGSLSVRLIYSVHPLFSTLIQKQHTQTL